MALYGRHSNPRFVEILKIIGFDREWARAEGAYLYDREGTKFLDWLGGFGMFNVGRNNPTVRAALAELLELETPSLPQLGLSDLPGLLAEALVAIAPARTDRVVFVNSGTEAVEAALKLGRAATRRSRVVAAENGFHGLTLGLAVGERERRGARAVRAAAPGRLVRPVQRPRRARGRARTRGRRGLHRRAGPGPGRDPRPSRGYLPGAQELCRRYGTLFCVDEVQTGFGRTGRMFACEHWGLEPDLITVAKALSGGYVPVGALLLSTRRPRGGLRHARARDVARLDVRAERHGDGRRARDAARARRRRISSRARRRSGTYLLERTSPLVERFDVVKDVRGLGLIWAIEFGEPSGGSRTWRLIEGRQPGLFSQFVIGPLFREHHILTQVAGHGINVLKGLPPLVIARGRRRLVRGRARRDAREGAETLPLRGRIRRARAALRRV